MHSSLMMKRLHQLMLVSMQLLAICTKTGIVLLFIFHFLVQLFDCGFVDLNCGFEAIKLAAFKLFGMLLAGLHPLPVSLIYCLFLQACSKLDHVYTYSDSGVIAVQLGCVLNSVNHQAASMLLPRPRKYHESTQSIKVLHVPSIFNACRCLCITCMHCY